MQAHPLKKVKGKSRKKKKRKKGGTPRTDFGVAAIVGGGKGFPPAARAKPDFVPFQEQGKRDGGEVGEWSLKYFSLVDMKVQRGKKS